MMHFAGSLLRWRSDDPSIPKTILDKTAPPQNSVYPTLAVMPTASPLSVCNPAPNGYAYAERRCICQIES
jgi:hypothetical protein